MLIINNMREKLTGDNMENKVWEEEQNYLEKTLQAIDNRISGLKDNVEKQQKWATELKRQYIRDLREFDEVEFIDNYSKLNELLDFTDDQIVLMQKLRRVRDKPYFGRIDFKAEDDDEPMKLYIGIMSVDNNNRLFVIDWRAPISELFYEAGKGEASYLAPNGEIKGEVLLKRQYDIENAKLRNIFDVDLNIFDSFLQEVLARAKGQQLANIASTIQKEQNQIIRNLKDDIIVVQGYAGCGKTTIALHRVAYALYRLPNLSSANVLLFSPNDAFSTYISQVLPELGEENTRNATFPKFIKRFLKTYQAIESSDEFVTRYVMLSEKEQKDIETKLAFSMREKMKAWLEDINANLEFKDGFDVDGQTFDKDSLNKLLKEDFKHAKLKEKALFIVGHICQKCRIDGFDKKEMVVAQVYEKLNSPVRLENLYDKFLKDFKFKPLDIDEKIPFEDAVLMCVLKEMCQNVVLKIDVRHIVLDEAQDYPLIFIDFLLRIFKHATFSIFGDINQKTVFGELNSLQDICNLDISNGRAKYFELDKTYRSSEEIVEYTSGLVGNPRHNAFRLKNNNPVEEMQIADNNKSIAEQILSILEQNIARGATIGIITGDTSVARGIYDELIKVISPEKLTFVKNAYVTAGSQVQVVPVALSKGLEFDTAIVVQKGELFDFDKDNHFMFIATTRAINKLIILKNKQEEEK